MQLGFAPLYYTVPEGWPKRQGLILGIGLGFGEPE